MAVKKRKCAQTDINIDMCLNDNFLKHRRKRQKHGLFALKGMFDPDQAAFGTHFYKFLRGKPRPSFAITTFNSLSLPYKAATNDEDCFAFAAVVVMLMQH